MGKEFSINPDFSLISISKKMIKNLLKCTIINCPSFFHEHINRGTKYV